MDAETTPTRRAGRCRLTLTIDGEDYAVRPIASEADDVPRAFRLTRGEAVYDVAQTIHGPTCDCPDFIFRRDGLDPLGCVHVRAMRAVGILPAAQATPAPKLRPGGRAC